MNEIVIALIALLATLSVVAALVAVAVYAMSRKPNRAETPAVRRQHVNPVDMSWRYVSVNVEGPCRDIDSDSWRDQLWFDALVESKFGASDGELAAEVFETDRPSTSESLTQMQQPARWKPASTNALRKISPSVSAWNT